MNNIKVNKDSLKILISYNDHEKIVKECLSGEFNNKQIQEILYMLDNVNDFKNIYYLTSTFLGYHNKNMLSTINLFKHIYTFVDINKLYNECMELQFVKNVLKKIECYKLRDLVKIKQMPKLIKYFQQKAFEFGSGTYLNFDSDSDIELFRDESDININGEDTNATKDENSNIVITIAEDKNIDDYESMYNFNFVDDNNCYSNNFNSNHVSNNHANNTSNGKNDKIQITNFKDPNNMYKYEFIMSFVYGYTMDKILAVMIRSIPKHDSYKTYYISEQFPFIGYEEYSKDHPTKITSNQYLLLSPYGNIKSYNAIFYNHNHNYFNALLRKTSVEEIETRYLIIPDYYCIADSILSILGCKYEIGHNTFGYKIDPDELKSLIDADGDKYEMFAYNNSNKFKIVFPEKKSTDMVKVTVKARKFRTLFFNKDNINIKCTIWIGYEI
jgi:hypothetical protein